MKDYSIEDEIIAYFDGRLNDADGADLLHRASVSPEIRTLFQEHSALRRMAVRAARQATIAPELEESLFQRIEELREEEKLPIGFWTLRRFSVTAGVVALLIAGIVNSFDSANNNITQAGAAKQAASNQYSVASVHLGKINSEQADYPPISLASSVGNGPESKQNAPVIANEESPAIVIHPVPQTAGIAGIEVPTEGPHTLQSLRNLPTTDGPSRFEVGVSSPMSGIMIPAAAPQQAPFSEQSVFLAYRLDEKNQVGLRLTRGNFDWLAVKSARNAGFTSFTGQLESQTNFTEEIIYQHREPVSEGLFFVVGGIGGGFYSLGNVLSAEVGIQVPFSSRFLGGVSLVADRLHQNGVVSPSAIVGASSGPVIYSGSSVSNTLAGHIEYALTYQF